MDAVALVIPSRVGNKNPPKQHKKAHLKKTKNPPIITLGLSCYIQLFKQPLLGFAPNILFGGLGPKTFAY